MQLSKSYIHLTLDNYNFVMMKFKIQKLRDDIAKYINDVPKDTQVVYEILSDLNRMIHLNTSQSMMFQWWVENKNDIESVNTIMESMHNK